MTLFEEYKKTLKMVEVEEVLDLVFYRPLAFIFVKSILKTNLTPNHLTIISILFGVMASVMLGFANANGYIFAGVFFIIYDVLDCSDGQLARLKKNGTYIGRILDGFGDYIVSIAAYLGIGFGFANHSNDPLFWWGMIIAAGASNAIHSSMLDYYRNRFLDYALNRKSMLGDDLKFLREEYNRLLTQKGKKFDKVMLWIYFKYSAVQLKFSSSTIESETKKYNSADFYNKNKLIIHLWTYLGPTTEISLLILCAFINRIDIYLIGLITVGNILAGLFYLIQRNINSSTKLTGQL